MSRAFIITRLFIVGALFAATACTNGNTTTGPDPSHHVLVEIDPKPIPYVIPNDPFYERVYVADSGTTRRDAIRLER